VFATIAAAAAAATVAAVVTGIVGIGTRCTDGKSSVRSAGDVGSTGRNDTVVFGAVGRVEGHSGRCVGLICRQGLAGECGSGTLMCSN